MKLIIALTLLAALVGCGQGPVGKSNRAPDSTPAISQSETAIPNASGLTLASAITNGNVTVYPVISKRPHNQELDDMVTLDEAKKNGWVDIIERENETVEELVVINTGPKPIFLMAGEVLLGGKQDRIIAEDTIVKPGQKAFVKVFCVDQGRWSGGEKFESSSMQAPKGVKEAAIMDKDQGLVWGRVAETNDSLAHIEPSLSVSESASLKVTVDSKALKARQADAAKVAAEMLKLKDAVGLVTVVNGEVESFEYFGSNKLFGKALPSLLNGVFADSLVAKPGESKGKAGPKEAAAFVGDCLSGRTTKDELRPAGYRFGNSEGASNRGATTYFQSRPEGRSPAAKKVLRGSFFSK